MIAQDMALKKLEYRQERGMRHSGAVFKVWLKYLHALREGGMRDLADAMDRERVICLRCSARLMDPFLHDPFDEHSCNKIKYCEYRAPALASGGFFCYSVEMKKDTHPIYYGKAEVVCGCGSRFTVGSTKEKIEIEICNSCHPFFSGNEKVIDAAGRVEKFRARAAAKAVTPTARTKKLPKAVSVK